MKKNLLIGLILLIGLTILLVGGNGSIYNQRVNPEIAINQKNMNFQSKLKDRPTDNLEKASSIPELVKQQIAAPTDENSPAVKTGDSITVNYKGWLASNGKVFDQSFERGNTGFTFTVGERVISGWSEGVVGMKQGEIRRLKIPYAKAYGDQGAGSTIPPKSDLMFDVELISIN